jgi:hypothetical protein
MLINKKDDFFNTIFYKDLIGVCNELTKEDKLNILNAYPCYGHEYCKIKRKSFFSIIPTLFAF